jgi:hypothetical protein
MLSATTKNIANMTTSSGFSMWKVDLHLLAKLDHATDGNLKIGGGLLGELAGEGEEVLAPFGHAGRFAGDDDLAAEEEGGFFRLDLEVVIGALTQKSRDVGLLHEAEATRDTPEVVAEFFDLDPTARWHPGLVLRGERHEDDALMDGLVVL